jgi:hypothetical protein
VKRSHHQRGARGLPLLLALVMALGALMLAARPATAQTPTEEGCDPEEPIACLALPDEVTADGPAIAAPRAPQPPVPCPPAVFAEPDTRIAAPQPPSGRCDDRAVVATINYANLLYAHAFRTLDTRELPNAWRGEALNQVRGYVAQLRSAGRYATPELRSISLEGLRIDRSSAHVRTLENWLYQERDRLSGRIDLQENQWVINEYGLERQGGAWFVVRNEVFTAPAPLPPPPTPRPPSMPCILIYPPPPGCEPGQPQPEPAVTVSTDRGQYRLGDTITATVTNTGTETIYGGGGVVCGLVAVEHFARDRWERVPIATICPAIAIGLGPGESRTETFDAGPFAGRYRLAVSVSGERGGQVTAYSDPYAVRP